MKPNLLKKPHPLLLILASLLGSASPAFAGGGTNTGGSGDGAKYVAVVSQWCRSEDIILQQYLKQARLSDLMQNTQGTVNLLLQGLQQALDNTQSLQIPQQSLTYRAISRGLELGRMLADLGRPDPTGRKLEAARDFLIRYYDFVQKVESRLDVPMYIPYEFKRTGADFDLAAFERAFGEYARDQLRLYLDVFVKADREQDGLVPRYSTQTALKVLEFTSRAAADDLAHSLWADKYACAIGLLEQLNQNLAAYNGGNPAFYVNDRYAFNLSAQSAQELVADIAEGCAR